MYCQTCGIAVSQPMKYCNRCGALVSQSETGEVKASEKRFDETQSTPRVLLNRFIEDRESRACEMNQ